MGKKLIFTVIVPYFNSSGTIDRALDSLFRQTFKSFEIVLVDDASTEVVEFDFSWHEENFKRIGIRLTILKLCQNSGPGVARNYGWEHASGDYVAFLDADDVWHKDRLKVCYQLLIRQSPALVVNSSRSLRDLSEDTTAQLKLSHFETVSVSRFKLLIKNIGATPAIIVKASIEDRFDPSMRYCEDHDLWLRIANKSAAPLVYLRGPVLTFLGRKTMTSGGQSENLIKMRCGEIRMYYKFCQNKKNRLMFFPVFICFSLFKLCILVCKLKLGRF
jgi:teichuronic acid biosynthesis glycosyltransferase TuaG